MRVWPLWSRRGTGLDNSSESQVPTAPPVTQDGRAIAPKTGDVLIVERHGNPSTRHVLSQVGGGPELSFTSRQRAEEVARAFAHDSLVDIWFGEGDECALVARYRPR